MASRWEGDDQEWWDGYMTLAADPGPGARPVVRAPEAPAVAPASDREVEAALAAPYPLGDEAVGSFTASRPPCTATPASKGTSPAAPTTS